MSRAPESTREGDVAPLPSRPGSVHWLIRVAERAGLAAREALDIPPGTPAREAWPVLIRAFYNNPMTTRVFCPASGKPLF